MKFFHTVNDQGATEISTVPGELDAWPTVPRLRTDRAVSPSSGDRMAVACLLAFGTWCSGAMHFPKPISALTAERIGEWVEGKWFHPSPVHPGNLPIPRGTESYTLVKDLNVPRHVPRQGHVIASVPASREPSSSISPNQIRISSNAWMIEAGDDNSLGSWGPHLALFVLYSEQLAADSVCVPGLSVSVDMADSLGQMFAACGLGLDVT